MNNSLICRAVTSSTNLIYSVDIYGENTEYINNYFDKNCINELCHSGCINYNRKWSCPPHSPDYRDFSAQWNKLFVLYARMELVQFSYVKNDYLKIMAANSILKSRADRFLRHMAARYGSFISTGSCRLCKPCRCKSGLPCARPKLMTYSFEAMGVNVGKLVSERFQKPLLWYKPGCLPEYTAVVCGLLTNDELTVDDIQTEYLQFAKG